MSARADLLATATAIATRSRGLISVAPTPDANVREAAQLAHGAKAALEAAQLVDAEPAPIIAASERLAEKLAQLGVETDVEIAAQIGAAEAIDAVTGLVEGMTAVARRANAVDAAYGRLDALCEVLLVDFTAAETETASRIATRIETAMAGAREAMKPGREARGG